MKLSKFNSRNIDWSSVPSSAKPVFAPGTRVRRNCPGLRSHGMLATIVAKALATPDWEVRLDEGGSSEIWHQDYMLPDPEESKPANEVGPGSSFDFGPFTRDDWDWLLGEARKQDPEAVVFIRDGDTFFMSRLNGTGSAYFGTRVQKRDSVSLVNVNVRAGYDRARAEHRVYPDDCPIARAKWAAKPVEESDADWLKRNIRELTGLECKLERDTGRYFLVVSLTEGPQNFGITLGRDGASRERDRIALAETYLGAYGWPLKDSAGVGSADSAKGNSAATVREESIGVFGSAQPTPAEAKCPARCAECDAPVQHGQFICGKCAIRRGQAEVQQIRQPCGDGCRCVYCSHATYDGKHPREVTDAKAWLSTRGLGRNVAARKRLAALEARELRLNDPNPAEVKMLDGARDALRRWPSVGDDEP